MAKKKAVGFDVESILEDLTELPDPRLHVNQRHLLGEVIVISNNRLLGPDNMVSADNYHCLSGYAEDPVGWRSRHPFHCIYNCAMDRQSGYMCSLDGIQWKNEEGRPYDTSSTSYTE
ncbi:hypothetical protein CA13_28620 [Planctomycetes bacterium CA13]|uniref:Uncharacterized protein n=1 Tax=Novipirellula herctigrandis TaxID=2527986 RepID=A0A5C5Z232_9BACT|nr:hypothetical protein CA13_28620 [Planctomycetes bacterium CA13]